MFHFFFSIKVLEKYLIGGYNIGKHLDHLGASPKGIEIFNFCQDDLNSEDVLVVHNFSEIYIWVGHDSFVTSTSEAFIIGKRFLEADILLEGLSTDTAMYVIKEGSEPPFFTCFFSWDSAKTNMHGNSFERKLSLLKGLEPLKLKPQSFKLHRETEAPSEVNLGYGSNLSFSSTLHCRGLTSPVPRSTKSSIGNNCLEDGFPKSMPMRDGESRLSVEVVTQKHHASLDDRTCKLPADDLTEVLEEGKGAIDNLKMFPYNLLKVPSHITHPEIDVTKREAYLPDKEFQDKFGMSRNTFCKLPFWRQKQLKMALHLF